MKTDKELIAQILEKALDLILNKYLESRDFNGLPASHFLSEPEVAEDTVRSLVAALLESKNVIIRFSGNPHIKAFSEVPKLEEQKQAIIDSSLDQLCLYPSPDILKKKANILPYHDRPYTKALVLGCGQLDQHFFKAEVLERYAKNPLYEVSDDGTSGKINTRSEVFENDQFSEEFSEEDEVYLDYGSGYSNDESKQRLIVVFPRYLHNLSSTHQLHWYSHRTSPGLIDSDFAARSYQGEFTQNISVYEAILLQIREINKICTMIGAPSLFKNTFYDGVPDPSYGPMKRSTLRESRVFALSLRKIVLDNINKDFFKNRLNINEVGTDENGKKIEKYKSETRLLQEWFKAIRYRPASEEVIPSIVDPLKELSSARGAEAHTIYEDKLDKKYLEDHRKLITSVYHALDGLRVVLSTHPNVKGKYSGPEELESLKIKY